MDQLRRAPGEISDNSMKMDRTALDKDTRTRPVSDSNAQSAEIFKTKLLRGPNDSEQVQNIGDGNDARKPTLELVESMTEEDYRSNLDDIDPFPEKFPCYEGCSFKFPQLRIKKSLRGKGSKKPIEQSMKSGFGEKDAGSRKRKRVERSSDSDSVLQPVVKMRRLEFLEVAISGALKDEESVSTQCVDDEFTNLIFLYRRILSLLRMICKRQ